MKNRKAMLIPKYINVRIEDNKMSVQYEVKDSSSGVHVNDVWINFTPSEALLNKLEEEVDIAIKEFNKSSY